MYAGVHGSTCIDNMYAGVDGKSLYFLLKNLCVCVCVCESRTSLKTILKKKSSTVNILTLFQTMY